MKTKVYICRFFISDKDRCGELFYLCEDHLKSQKIPDGCILEKIGIALTENCGKEHSPSEKDR